MLRISNKGNKKKNIIIYETNEYAMQYHEKNKGTSHTLLKSLVFQRDEILNIWVFLTIKDGADVKELAETIWNRLNKNFHQDR